MPTVEMSVVFMSALYMVSACEDVADHRDHLRAVQLDGAQASADRLGSRGVDEVKPADAERLDGAGDLAGDRLGRADVEGAVRDLALVLLPAYRRPAPQCADGIADD